jgi:hypothetical protein
MITEFQSGLLLGLVMGFFLGVCAGTVVLSFAQITDPAIDLNIGMSQLQPYPADTMPREEPPFPQWTPFRMPCD